MRFNSVFFSTLLVLAWTGPDLAGGVWPKVCLTLAGVGLFLTPLVGSETPRRSTAFHLLGAAVVALLFLAWRDEFAAGGLPARHAATTRVWLWLFAAVPAGAWAAFRVYPGTWACCRSELANLTWPFFYLVIAGGARVPKPQPLSTLYRGREAELTPLALFPYYLAHPRNLTHPVSVPCLSDALSRSGNSHSG